MGFNGAFPPELEYAFGFKICAIISHKFFRNHALTIDTRKMRILIE